MAKKFQRKNNKTNRVYAWICQICSKSNVGKANRKFWAAAKADPQIQLRLLNNIGPEPIPIVDGWVKYSRWKMARNSLLARLGLIDKKPPFDIVKHVMRKVKYGRMTIEEAEERINNYYERHPECRLTTTI